MNFQYRVKLQVDSKKEFSLHGNKVKPQEGFDGF